MHFEWITRLNCAVFLIGAIVVADPAWAQASCPEPSGSGVVLPTDGINGRIVIEEVTRGSFSGCLEMRGCVWTTPNARADLPLEPAYTDASSSSPPCMTMFHTGGGRRMACDSSEAAAQVLAPLEHLMERTSVQCSGDGESSISARVIDGSRVFALPLDDADECVVLLVRQRDGAVGIGVVSTRVACRVAAQDLPVMLESLLRSALLLIAAYSDSAEGGAPQLWVSIEAVPTGASVRFEGPGDPYLLNTWLPAVVQAIGATDFPRVLSSVSPDDVGLVANAMQVALMRLEAFSPGPGASSSQADDFEAIEVEVLDWIFEDTMARSDVFFRPELLGAP